MKILPAGFLVITMPFLALAQEDARDIARDMGADTTTAVAPGADRTGTHRDTDNLSHAKLHAPNLLEPSQGTSAGKSELKKEELIRRRNLLLADRDNTLRIAAKNAGAMPQASPSGGRFMITSTKSVGDPRKEAQKEAASKWDAKRGSELRALELAIKATSKEEKINEQKKTPKLYAPNLAK